MSSGKYPFSLFIIGFITCAIFRFFWLFLPSMVLMMVGLFVTPCLYIGLLVLALDIVLSLVEQLRLRRTFLKESDSSDFNEFAKSVSQSEDWRDGVASFLERKMTSAPPVEAEDETSSDSTDDGSAKS